MTFSVHSISNVICRLIITNTVACVVAGIVAGYAMAELFTAEEKQKFVPYLGHICTSKSQEQEYYKEGLQRAGICWERKQAHDKWDASNLRTFLEDPENSAKVINRLEVGKTFTHFSHYLIGWSTVGTPPVDGLIQSLKWRTREDSLFFANALFDSLHLETGHQLNYASLKSNYEALFTYMAYMPGIDPKTLLAVNPLRDELGSFGFVTGVQPFKETLFNYFHERFFILAGLHELKPLMTKSLAEDPGFETMKAPFFFRHPIPKEESPITYLQGEGKQNLIYIWPREWEAYFEQEERNVWLETESIERFMLYLAEPVDGVQRHNQDFLFLIDSFVVPEKKKGSKQKQDHKRKEALWLGVRGDDLYVAIYPSDGFFLLYQVPKSEQKVFIASLVGELRFPSISETGKKTYALNAVLFNKDTTTFNQPYPYPVDVWKDLCDSVCCFLCIKAGCGCEDESDQEDESDL